MARQNVSRARISCYYRTRFCNSLNSGVIPSEVDNKKALLHTAETHSVMSTMITLKTYVYSENYKICFEIILTLKFIVGAMSQVLVEQANDL